MRVGVSSAFAGFMGAGDWFGEVGLMANAGLRTATCRSASAVTECFVLTKAAFEFIVQGAAQAQDEPSTFTQEEMGEDENGLGDGSTTGGKSSDGGELVRQGSSSSPTPNTGSESASVISSTSTSTSFSRSVVPSIGKIRRGSLSDMQQFLQKFTSFQASNHRFLSPHTHTQREPPLLLAALSLSRARALTLLLHTFALSSLRRQGSATRFEERARRTRLWALTSPQSCVEEEEEEGTPLPPTALIRTS